MATRFSPSELDAFTKMDVFDPYAFFGADTWNAQEDLRRHAASLGMTVEQLAKKARARWQPVRDSEEFDYRQAQRAQMQANAPTAAGMFGAPKASK
jgi:hypothetical protein